MKAVTATDIVKSYTTGKTTTIALQKLSFEVNNGELFGVIGPDGAGKTSLFRILTSLLLPDEGAASVAGFDVVRDYKEIRQRIGYMPGKFSLYQDLTVAENLEFFASIFNTSIAENYNLVKDIYVQIEPFKNRRAGKLSGGMKQKLALCCALIHKPSVLFLDEPTTGVDAVSRKEFWEMLKRLKAQGITILVSTPYMDEASLCNRVALMQSGKILSINTPENIINSFSKPLLAVQAENMFGLLKALQQLPEVADAYPFGEYHHVVLKEGSDSKQLSDKLKESEFPGLEIIPAKANIEDCFIQLMKN
ncbi:ABC transporter ATP-binding protein [Rubrolithibacter danxiaensis]|uniref:ABC transporter ATP-binding protein n=1 Tax=Rubrolithibacter danxiaensis TaxID=3390805 RepID=UPI003BF8A675